MTLDQMISRIRMYVDDSGSKPRFSSEKVREAVNHAQSLIAQMLMDADEDLFVGIECFKADVSTDYEFDLPEDFVGVVSLESLATNPPLRLKKVEFPVRHSHPFSDPYEPGGEYSSNCYYIRGKKLGLPKGGTGNLRLVYMKLPPEMVEPDDVSEVPVAFHDTMCLQAAELLTVISGFTFSLAGHLSELKREMVRRAEDRASGNEPRYVNLQP